VHNIGSLLRLAQKNPQIFSKAALGLRKQGTDKTPPTWLGSYLDDAYVPRPSDFRRLHAAVQKKRIIYEQKYRDLRHRVFAHKEISDPDVVAALFAKTNIRELQLLLTFLGSLHNALWQLFENGRKPVLIQRRYSVRRMRDKPSPHNRAGVHERITHEAGRFLTAASRA
jgi:hypothetical protein